MFEQALSERTKVAANTAAVTRFAVVDIIILLIFVDQIALIVWIPSKYRRVY